jgi:hypothetical protein
VKTTFISREAEEAQERNSSGRSRRIRICLNGNLVVFYGENLLFTIYS